MTDTASGAGTDDAAYHDPNSSYLPPDALPSPQPVQGFADEYGGLSRENYDKGLEFFNELKDAASRKFEISRNSDKNPQIAIRKIANFISRT